MKCINIKNLLIVCFLISNDAAAQPAGTSLLFNGVDNYVNVPDNPLLDFSDSLSIEVWLKPDDVIARAIVTKGICMNNNYGFQFFIDTGRVAFGWNPNGSCQGGFGNYALTDSAVIIPYHCVHVAVVFDRPNVSVYINGTPVSVTTTLINNTPIQNSTEPLRIGVYRKINPVELVRYYSGEMDELRFWNYKLDSAEINARMNVSLVGNEPGLVAYYDFEELGIGNGFTVPNKCTSTGSVLNGSSVGNANSPTHIPVCSSVGLIESLGNFNFKMYPNPSDGNFMIDFGTKNISVHTVILTNILSQEVYSIESALQRLPINLKDNIIPGIYFLKVSDYGSNVESGKKIIIY